MTGSWHASAPTLHLNPEMLLSKSCSLLLSSLPLQPMLGTTANIFENAPAELVEAERSRDDEIRAGSSAEQNPTAGSPFPSPSPTHHGCEGSARRMAPRANARQPASKGGQEGKTGDRGGQQLHCQHGDTAGLLALKKHS